MKSMSGALSLATLNAMAWSVRLKRYWPKTNSSGWDDSDSPATA
jgi:hypothetical protein